ncbi:MAG: radical SAM protein [Thermoplasmata archaeon]|nr:MAG: radical SAM protein [Thermoplasmata archaeon]
MTVDNRLIDYSCFHPDQIELKKYFQENKVYTVQIESNLACRQGCLYCYASSNEQLNNELPKEIVISVLDSAANMGVRAIDWLGGDPLERKDWYELMKYSMNLGLKNNIWTSGLPLVKTDTAKKAVEVSEGGFISVHVDTINERLYKGLHTGIPKEKIDAIIKGVDNVLALGKSPEAMFNCITFVKLLTKEDVEQTIRFFYEKKGMRTCLTQMCRVGSALEHPEWIPTNEEIREAVEIRDSINYPNSSVSMSTMDANKFYCGGAICVTIDGDVTPCSVIRKGFGNVYDEPLETINEKNKDSLLYTKLRDVNNLPGNCGSCKNNGICWGCRASAYYEAGDILAKDPKCMIGKY